jgi:hypothetical protein
MITTGPLKPSSRSVAAAVPPVVLPPMITIGLVLGPSDMYSILPQPRSAKQRIKGGE